MKKVLKNIAVGVDIEEIERFNVDFKKRKNFLERIFTKKELKYCLSKNNPSPHLAARFAGKEAVYKAVFSLKRKGIDFKDIEIIKESAGMPTVKIREKSLKSYRISLSITHSKDIAAAFAVIYN